MKKITILLLVTLSLVGLVPSVYAVDDDGDGYSATPDGDDCNDNVYDVNPGETEMCNGIDDNCDGTVDEDTAADATVWYFDADWDGYGDSSVSEISCVGPAGYISDSSDCDDTNDDVFPDMNLNPCGTTDWDCDGSVTSCEDGTTTETNCSDNADNDGDGATDGSDTDCFNCGNGTVEELEDCDDGIPNGGDGCSALCENESNYFRDSDGDGYGDVNYLNSLGPSDADVSSGNYVSNSTDCDDTNSSINTAANEACDNVDNDCDGETDEGVMTAWYPDNDGDGYGIVESEESVEISCQPAGYVENSTDCNDLDEAISPAATEVCNGMDDDCDGLEDDGVSYAYYIDRDGDGYGEDNGGSVSCETLPSDGFVTNGDDCDDENNNRYTGNTETCGDTIDQDCDELDLACEDPDNTDDDADGIPDAEDNCPLLTNADQLDTDSDNSGNVCDTDNDGNDVLIADNTDDDSGDAVGIADTAGEGDPLSGEEPDTVGEDSDGNSADSEGNSQSDGGDGLSATGGGCSLTPQGPVSSGRGVLISLLPLGFLLCLGRNYFCFFWGI